MFAFEHFDQFLTFKYKFCFISDGILGGEFGLRGWVTVELMV